MDKKKRGSGWIVALLMSLSACSWEEAELGIDEYCEEMVRAHCRKAEECGLRDISYEKCVSLQLDEGQCVDVREDRFCPDPGPRYHPIGFDPSKARECLDERRSQTCANYASAAACSPCTEPEYREPEHPPTDVCLEAPLPIHLPGAARDEALDELLLEFPGAEVERYTTGDFSRIELNAGHPVIPKGADEDREAAEAAARAFMLEHESIFGIDITGWSINTTVSSTWARVRFRKPDFAGAELLSPLDFSVRIENDRVSRISGSLMRDRPQWQWCPKLGPEDVPDIIVENVEWLSHDEITLAGEGLFFCLGQSQMVTRGGEATCDLGYPPTLRYAYEAHVHRSLPHGCEDFAFFVDGMTGELLGVEILAHCD